MNRPRRPKPIPGRPSPGGSRHRSSSASSPQASQYHALCLDGARFLDQKDYGTARQIYAKAMTLTPGQDKKAVKGWSRCVRKLARRAFKKEDFVQVADLLAALFAEQRAASLLGGRDYLVYGEACAALGRIEEAQRYLSRAEDLSPQLVDDIQRLQKRLQAARLHQEMDGLF